MLDEGFIVYDYAEEFGGLWCLEGVAFHGGVCSVVVFLGGVECDYEVMCSM